MTWSEHWCNYQSIFPKLHTAASGSDEKVTKRLLEHQNIENDLAQVHSDSRGWQQATISQALSMAPLDISATPWACGTYGSTRSLSVPKVCLIWWKFELEVLCQADTQALATFLLSLACQLDPLPMLQL